MKKILKLSAVLWLLFAVGALSACVLPPGTGEKEDESINSNQEQDYQQPPSKAVSKNDEALLMTSAPIPQAEEKSDIIEVNRANTVGPGVFLSELGQTVINERLSGLLDGSAPHGVEDHTNGIIMAGEVYVLNERYEDEIYEGIKIGSDFEKIRAALGKPGWETDSSLLYRTIDYYIMFHGNNAAQYAVLIKAPNSGADKSILKAIVSSLNADSYTSLEKSLEDIDPDRTFFDSTGFINGGGYYAHSCHGVLVLDFDEKYIEVYNNYDGSLFDYSGESPRYEVRFIDRDMTVDTILADLNSYLEIEERFETEGIISPDGRLSAIYEWLYSMDQHFIIRTLDHSIQDRYIYAATFSGFHWLTNSHLVYLDAYNDLPYAIDVNFSAPSAINILFEAGIIQERDAEYGKYKFEILGVENGILSLKDTLKNKIYKINVIAGKNGDLKMQEVQEGS